jgi:hypothetical protein
LGTQPRAKFSADNEVGKTFRAAGYFSGDLPDEACSDIDRSSGELAKLEAAIQDSLAGRARWYH